MVLGEIHDNPTHHAFQASVVEALQPAAIVFEMIEPRHAQAAADLSRDDPAPIEAAFEWEARGWPDFGMYFAILTAAPEATLYGAAFPPSVVRNSVGAGAAAQFGDGAALFGLDQPVPPAQLETRITLQDDAHCNAMPKEMLPGMVEAQRLRDAGLARTALTALTEARERQIDQPVVVITGNGHARKDWGMPAMLRLASPELTIASIAQLEGPAPDDPPYSHWVVTDPIDRPDPCDAFR